MGRRSNAVATLVERTGRDCFVCGLMRFLELPAHAAAALSGGAPAQQVLRELSRAEREQLTSGTHPALDRNLR